MVSKKKDEPPKAVIEPFGEILSPAVSLLQAANALDVAAQMAEYDKDSGRLVEIAQVYVIISNALSGNRQPETEEVEDVGEIESEGSPTPVKFKMGFTAREVNDNE